MHDVVGQPVCELGLTSAAIERPARAWALRILPPLLLLWPLSTRNGTLLYLCGMWLMPIALWCFVTFIANLFRWQLVQMVRPGMCLAICLAWPAYVAYAMTPAAHFANALAERMQDRCDAAGRCPARIPGWSTRSPGHGSMGTYGEWVKWPVAYWTDGTEFRVGVIAALDVGRSARGGVGKKLVRIDPPMKMGVW
jgi:hypothetical protein